MNHFGFGSVARQCVQAEHQLFYLDIDVSFNL